MKYFIEISMIILFLVIFFQDIRLKAISWFLPPMLACLSVCYSLNLSGIYDLLFNTAFNLVALGIITGCLVLYTRIRFRSWRLHDFIGSGDLLFLLSVCFLFSPVSFILFISFGSLAILTGYGLFLLLSKRSSFNKVPLAGLQSMIILIAIIIGWIEPYGISVSNLLTIQFM